MVEDKKNGKEKKQKNKGVNATFDRINKDYFSDTDNGTQSLGASKSISRVKNELQAVIDLMGPSTPQYLQSPSNDGDNELSSTSEPTNNSLQKGKPDEPVSVAFSTPSTDDTIPPDLTLEEVTDFSIVADKNSTTFEVQDSPRYVCPPPMLPVNLNYNSECMCPQVANYIQNGPTSFPPYGVQKECKKMGRHKNFLYSIFRNLTSGITEKGYEQIPAKCEYYTMNIKESLHDNSPPRRLVFDLVGDVPRYNCKLEDDFNEQFFPQTFRSVKTKELKNFNNEQLTKETQQSEVPVAHKESVQTFDKTSKKFNQKSVYPDSPATRVDVYYFDRGDENFLKTTDCPPLVMTEHLAEKTEAYTTRFWAEIFGTIHIGMSFGISFVLQLFRFLLYSLLRPLTVGIVQLGTDYFLKPCIATIFNAIIQPPLTFLLNLSLSLRDVCRPIAEGLGFFTKELTHLIRAFRIVDIRREKITDSSNHKEKDKGEEKTEKCELAA